MKKFLKELCPYAIIVIVVVLIRTYLITPGIVNGSSMESTLYNNELVLVNKIKLRKKGLERFDIVVVNYEKSKLIKRVIGLPNEKVEYLDNKLYINEELIISDITFEDTNDFLLETKDNEYVVLGDNRDISKDSRMIGTINIKDIKGIVNIRFFPFSKIGTVE